MEKILVNGGRPLYGCVEVSGSKNAALPIIYACVLEDAEAKDVLKTYNEPLCDKIWIVDDISQGVVPIEPDRRAWRESVGRTLLWLGKESDEVHRVFCGLGQKLK